MSKIPTMIIVIILTITVFVNIGLDVQGASGETVRTRSSILVMDKDISEASLASFLGEYADDRSGTSISCAGDVNGDGFDDILIGSYSDENGPSAGQTYLIFGKSSGWSMDINLSNVDASFLGEYAGDWTGYSVSGAGDVNNDGYDDILIGAFGNGKVDFPAGRTYLILGKENGWSIDTNISTADASFFGENRGDLSGFSVSSAGDVNGDSYDDILIGAPRGADKIDAGEVYLILGRKNGWRTNTNLSTADASFIGEDADDRLGHIVSGAGDVNGDGYDDILIGSDWNDEGGVNAGQTYLIFGKRSGWSMNTDLSEADASFIGSDYDRSSRSISNARDVNGDGYDDILIGAYDEVGSSKAGQTYLIFGKEYGWSMDTLLSTVDASFIGEYAGDLSGSAVSSAGDVNNDGLDDFLIGAYGNNEGGSRAGKTYLIFGMRTGWSIGMNLSEADASFIGEKTDDLSGVEISTAGDVNGDGFDDILIGSYSDDNGQSAGQTYLISGEERPKGPPSRPRNFSVISNDKSVLIRWAPPEIMRGSPLSSYIIYRNGSKIFELSPQETEFNDTSVINGIEYTYQMSAVNSFGESKKTNIISVVPSGLPDPPSEISGSVDNEFVDITWKYPNDDGGLDILEYNVYKEVDHKLVLIGSTSNMSYRDEDIGEGRTYTYQLTSVNYNGEGEPSEIIKVEISRNENKISSSTFWIILLMMLLFVGLFIFLFILLKRKKEDEILN